MKIDPTPESIALCAMGEAMEALKHFQETKDRTRFNEWLYRWEKTVELLQHTLEISGLAMEKRKNILPS